MGIREMLAIAGLVAGGAFCLWSIFGPSLKRKRARKNFLAGLMQSK